MKSKIIAAIAIAEGLILLLLAAFWVLDRGFDSLPMCGGKLYASAPSPDKTLVAYAFERDCGATTGFSSFVVLKAAGERLDLTADLDFQEIVFDADGDYHPTLKWTSKNTLRVSFVDLAPQNDQISFQAIKLWDRKIEYHGLPAP